MPKFFVKASQIKNDKIEIINEDVNHIANVLRCKIEDKLNICNIDDGINYETKIIQINKDSIYLEILKYIESESESNIHINILQGLPKADKMELIIQKTTELGAKEITPVNMERCVVKINTKDEQKKIDRWQKIAEVASKQSGRDIIPKVNNIIKLKDIEKILVDYDLVLVAYEKEEKNTLKHELLNLKEKMKEKSNLNIAILIGPEGGISENEVNYLEQLGTKIITLGKRILRTETVALAMTSIILYELENN
ncbi:MAG: 16S rRNA (uracil(1498)-N(3))-methyltransferase [Clostridia bacterium]|nr:16S rRNA (uracil(1498)-N(3))-methyltransferase [Clostridia bacterium]